MSITKNMLLNWYSSMKKKWERFQWFLTLKIYFELRFWHFLTSPHYTSSQNSIISFGPVDFYIITIISGHSITTCRTKSYRQWFLALAHHHLNVQRATFCCFALQLPRRGPNLEANCGLPFQKPANKTLLREVWPKVNDFPFLHLYLIGQIWSLSYQKSKFLTPIR